MTNGLPTRSNAPQEKPGRMHDAGPVLLIFLVALAVRLLYLYAYYRSDYWDIMALDPETHDRLARTIALDGQWLGAHSFFRAPLYIYLLAVIYKLCGPGYLAPRLLQALLGAGSASLSYLISRRLLSRKAAFGVGLCMAFYWANIYFDGELLIEPLVIFLDLLALLALVSGWLKSNRGALGAGLLLGLSAIARPNILLFSLAVIFVAAYGLRHRLQEALSRVAAVILGLALPILPVTMCNYLADGDLVLIASQGGINFWLGNNQEADGRTVVVPLHSEEIPSAFRALYKDHPWAKEEVWLSSAYAAYLALRHRPRESEISRYWYGEAWRWIIGHPREWTRLMLRKTYFLFHRTEVSNNRDLAYHVQQFPLLRSLAVIHFGLFSPLALVGFALAWKKRGGWLWPNLFLLFYGLSIVLFFVNTRFRMPLMPVFFMLAALTVEHMFMLARAKRYLAPALTVAATALLMYLCNADLVKWNDRPLRAAMHYNLGLAMSRSGRLLPAERELRTALGIKPAFSEARVGLGNVLALQGRLKEAVEEYAIALEQNPDFAEAHYNLGLTLLKMGEQESAREHLHAAHTLAPALFPETPGFPSPAPEDRSP